MIYIRKLNKDLLKNLLIFDSHCDTVNVLLEDNPYIIDKKDAHLTQEKIIKGGLKAQFFAIWVNPVYDFEGSQKKAMKLYNALENNLISTGFGEKVTSVSEMAKAIKNNKLACWISIEGGHIIENSTVKLQKFHELGVRSMTLTHSKNNDWADSNGDEPRWDGINKLGRQIIYKMDEMKIAIDVSHSSDKTIEDVLECSSMPIMASHTCARSICNIRRNLPDSLIKGIAEKKGYIGVNFFPGFLNKKIWDQIFKNIKKYEKWFEEKTKDQDNPDVLNKIEIDLYKKTVEGTGQIDLNAIIDHITHIADIGGTNCVGIGSDFDGIPSTPTDLKDVSGYPALVNRLYDRGFSVEQIRKIMGLNLINYMKYFD